MRIFKKKNQNRLSVYDLKETNKRLRREKRFAESLIDAAQAIMVVLDNKGKIIRVNPYMEKITGYKLEDIQGKNFFKTFIPKQKQKDFKKIFSDDNPESDKKRIITPIITKNKYKRIIGWHTKRLNSEEEKTNEIIAVGLNITERIKIEEDLRENEATLRSIFKAAPAGIGVACKRKLVRINEHMCEMLGYSEDELMGKEVRILYPDEEEYNRVRKEKQKQISAKGKGTVETKWKHKNGKIIDILLNSIPIDPKNPYSGLTFAALDITDRKKAEDELIKSEQRMLYLLETIPYGVYESDTKGRITTLNTSLERITEYNKDELIGMHIWDFMGSQKKALKSRFKKIIKEQPKPQPYTGKIITKNKKIINVEIDWTYKLDETDNIIGFVCVLADITERKKAEQKIKEYTTELEKRVKERTKELKEKNIRLNRKINELERFHKFVVGRELKMIELKKRVEELERQGK